jgi:hypothetical protein
MPEIMDAAPTTEGETPLDRSRSGNSVTVYMKDTIGALFLGLLSFALLLGWLRAEARNRRLIAAQEKTHGYHSTKA